LKEYLRIRSNVYLVVVECFDRKKASINETTVPKYGYYFYYDDLMIGRLYLDIVWKSKC